MNQIALFSDVRTVKRTLMERGATISPCGVYRYRLSRIWQPEHGLVVWILLNPSTADAVWDDPTVRRGIGFTQDWGYGGLIFVNLFAFRATSPLVMMSEADPIGPENDAQIVAAASGPQVRRVVVAWGQHGDFRDRDRHVTRLLREHGVRLECLGLTKEGHPRHPVRLAGDTRLVPYGEAA